MHNRHTYDYGIIGNCNFTAYVEKSTNVAWMCWPRFDSSFVFGAMLDKQKGGEFSIAPASEKHLGHQYYIPNTNVLVTEISTKEGSYRVIDFVPRFESFGRISKPLILMRKIEKISGSPRIKVVCRPVGNYGQTAAKRYIASNHIKFEALEKDIRLTTNLSLNYIYDEQSFVLLETSYLVLSWDQPFQKELKYTFEDYLTKTIDYWKKWVKHTSMPMKKQDIIIRSALILKLHQYEDTGAIIASGTTSLPESPGSTRNWDYRYCWMRDSYFTLSALNILGHFEEMFHYAQYIENIGMHHLSSIQPLYSITGADQLEEKEHDLAGYQGERPVRTGNGAYTQVQHDVYGQIILGLFPLYLDRRLSDEEYKPSVVILERNIDLIEKNMEEPDAGIWEFRGMKHVHCHTLLWHWAGSAAVEKIAREKKYPHLEKKAARLKNRASELIEKCWDPQRGVYTAAIGSQNLDASTFLLVTMNYLDPLSERARSHVKALADALKAPNGLIYRYNHADDFGEPEVAFSICGLWYAEALACVGELDQAKKVYAEHMKSANHLGLLSEDIDPKDYSQWGNFPQTYSHVGLIHCSYRISLLTNKPNFLL